MEIAKGKFTFQYSDDLNPLPESEIKDGIDLAVDKLKTALTEYISSIGKFIPSGQSLDIEIYLYGEANDVVRCKIDGEVSFLQSKDGRAYILKTE